MIIRICFLFLSVFFSVTSYAFPAPTSCPAGQESVGTLKNLKEFKTVVVGRMGPKKHEKTYGEAPDNGPYKVFSFNLEVLEVLKGEKKKFIKFELHDNAPVECHLFNGANYFEENKLYVFFYQGDKITKVNTLCCNPTIKIEDLKTLDGHRLRIENMIKGEKAGNK